MVVGLFSSGFERIVYMNQKQAHALWYSLHNGGTLQEETRWGGEELLNKVVNFVFFAHSILVAL